MTLRKAPRPIKRPAAAAASQTALPTLVDELSPAQRESLALAAVRAHDAVPDEPGDRLARRAALAAYTHVEDEPDLAITWVVQRRWLPIAQDYLRKVLALGPTAFEPEADRLPRIVHALLEAMELHPELQTFAAFGGDFAATKRCAKFFVHGNAIRIARGPPSEDGAMLVKLFRGISSPSPDEARSALVRGELNHPERNWTLWDLRGQTRRILEKPASFREVCAGTREYAITWACGDIGGAAFYACRGDHKPLVVELSVEVETLAVDCRDLLCPAFQLGTDAPRDVLEIRARSLESIYGASVLPYFWAACATRDQQEKIALCNAAAHEEEVVHAHLRNARVVRGRYGTTFRSAFAVRLPIPPSSIVRVLERLDSHVESPSLTLDDLR